MKHIDLANWPRKSLYDYFTSLPSPHFSVTAEVDVTRLMDEAKSEGVSVFNYALYAVMRTCNAIPEFRQRITADGVAEFDEVHPAPTVPIEGERFAFCYFDYAREWDRFDSRCCAAIEAGKRQTELKDGSGLRDNLIFTSCLPWINFTGITQPVQGPDDTFPRVSWGKINRQDEGWRMPVNVHAHHALIDGLHMGKFFDQLQDTFSALDGLSI